MPTNQPQILLELDSPWFFEPGVIRVFPTEGVTGEELRSQVYRDMASRPYIFENTLERRLHFTQCSTQSVMHLKDPDALITAYTRKMMSFLLFNSNPKEILMIGLGGGSLAKFCYRHLPNSRITVVEINKDVMALRDHFFIPKDDDRFRVIHDDGARYVETLKHKVDVVLVDAFDAEGIAASLPQTKFYLRAAAQLTRRGVLVMNFSGDGERYVDNVRASREAFRDHVVLVPVQSDENLLLFARRRALPQTITDDLEREANRLQSRLRLEFPRYLRRICQGYSLTNAKKEPRYSG
jgi:spermidine synthase